jgi:hypothetical protein
MCNLYSINPTSRRTTVKMSDPSAPSELEKRSTEPAASTPLKFSVLRLALAFVIAGVSDDWCFRELDAADRMGGRCRDCRAVVRRVGLAMAAFAGVGPRGDTGRRGTSILAAGGWSNCCLRHASAEGWIALRRRARGQRWRSMGI